MALRDQMRDWFQQRVVSFKKQSQSTFESTKAKLNSLAETSKEKNQVFVSKSKEKLNHAYKLTQNKANTLWQSIRLMIQKNQKKAVIIISSTATLLAVTIGGVIYYKTNLNTLYHVSIDGKALGTVSDPQLVLDAIQSMKTTEQAKTPDLIVYLPADVKFTEEVKYKGITEDERVLSALPTELADNIEIKAKAIAVKVNGEVLGYVSSQAEVDQILASIKDFYIPKEAKEVQKKRVQAAAAGSTSPLNDEIDTYDILENAIKEDVQTTPLEVNPDQLNDPKELQALLQKGTLEDQIYTVKPGDCISCIAYELGITSDDIYRNNPGVTENTVLQLGQKLNVTAYKPKVNVKTIMQATVQETISYDYKYIKDEKIPAGDQRIQQEGKEGKKRVTYRITLNNGVEQERDKLNEEILHEPVPMIIRVGTKVVANAGSGSFSWPTKGGVITSGYGYRWGSMHKGIDISGVKDKTIMASDNGTIVEAGWKGGYGNAVVIDHGNGTRTLYGHLSSINVKKGQVVEKGQKIGVMGSTGNSTGTHLHFEIHVNGSHINPMDKF
ncbi:peptidoglycan DD-metalloendopeptidase family protein [Rubeoparvulum massiliense]|uniref:peptidoglycan DD-metalloendopeptidase family protein n=1 Tax=Rubeoparvulum massiliense TaxID=1631346 RepID=UPI00065E6859|nr:peptidoglycan DD-metalloendopeptidase family protein [Rubeoparvulum massiliense]